jgi:hypothetical protein
MSAGYLLAMNRVKCWDFYEYGNKPPFSMKGGEFLDQLIESKLHRKGSSL